MRSRFLLALLLSVSTAPLLAADPDPKMSGRVDKLEKEMKAVQRKVFPGGSPAFFEPEIAPQPVQQQVGTPASQPLNDLTARVDGIERELSRLTSQVEENQHRVEVLTDQSAKDHREWDARLKALETAAAPPPPPAAVPILDVPPVKTAPAKGKGGKPLPLPADAPVDVAPIKTAPASGDPAEDAYMAGYKLWADKKYPEAEVVLDKVAKQYPKHKRASYARNLLGRSQLDEGKPATAAQTFVENYQTDPHGERAPESLFYLGQALTQLKKTEKACLAYNELQDVYGSTMAASLKARLPEARKAAACK